MGVGLVSFVGEPRTTRSPRTPRTRRAPVVRVADQATIGGLVSRRLVRERSQLASDGRPAPVPEVFGRCLVRVTDQMVCGMGQGRPW